MAGKDSPWSAIYRRLLRLFPQDYRGRVEESMLDTFDDLLREGIAALPGLYADILLHLIKERWMRIQTTHIVIVVLLVLGGYLAFHLQRPEATPLAAHQETTAAALKLLTPNAPQTPEATPFAAYQETAPADLKLLPPLPVALVPEDCPVSLPDASTRLYGSPDGLQAFLTRDGVWHSLPSGPNGGLVQKLVWKYPGYSAYEEQRPDLHVYARQLDGKASFEQPGPATNAMSPDLYGDAILTGVELPNPGCWEITAQYKNSQLSYVVWVEIFSDLRSELIRP